MCHEPQLRDTRHTPLHCEGKTRLKTHLSSFKMSKEMSKAFLYPEPSEQRPQHGLLLRCHFPYVVAAHSAIVGACEALVGLMAAPGGTFCLAVEPGQRRLPGLPHINEAQLVVEGGGEQHRLLAGVPSHTLHLIAVMFEAVNALALLHVPNLSQILNTELIMRLQGLIR